MYYYDSCHFSIISILSIEHTKLELTRFFFSNPEEDYEVLPYSRSEMYETDDPEDIIRNIFPPIRTIVPQEVSSPKSNQKLMYFCASNSGALKII